MAYPMAVGFRSILFSSISLSPETGMLVGGSINRAPEGLFGAAVAEGGLFDFLKVCECFQSCLTVLIHYHQFCNFTFGRYFTVTVHNKDLIFLQGRLGKANSEIQMFPVTLTSCIQCLLSTMFPGAEFSPQS